MCLVDMPIQKHVLYSMLCSHHYASERTNYTLSSSHFVFFGTSFYISVKQCKLVTSLEVSIKKIVIFIVLV